MKKVLIVLLIQLITQLDVQSVNLVVVVMVILKEKMLKDLIVLKIALPKLLLLLEDVLVLNLVVVLMEKLPKLMLMEAIVKKSKKDVLIPFMVVVKMDLLINGIKKVKIAQIMDVLIVNMDVVQMEILQKLMP